jgi:hypothetical protein
LIIRDGSYVPALQENLDPGHGLPANTVRYRSGDRSVLRKNRIRKRAHPNERKRDGSVEKPCHNHLHREGWKQHRNNSDLIIPEVPLAAPAKLKDLMKVGALRRI